MMGWALDWVLALVSIVVSNAPVGDPRLVPVRVVASSVGASEGSDSFEAGRLVDGDPTTAWQPLRGPAVGLGQWVRIELDRDYLISRVELSNGWQRADGALDHFCTHGIVGAVDAYGDRGHRLSFDSDRSRRTLTMVAGTSGNKRPLVTRSITLVVRSVMRGLTQRDSVALSEVRIWGRPAAAPSDEADSCASEARHAFVLALTETCASANERPNAECTVFPRLIWSCPDGTPEYPFPDAAALATGKVDYRLESHDPAFPVFTATFSRAPDGRWSASHPRCVVAGHPCGRSFEIASDGDDTDTEVRERKLCRRADGTTMQP